MAMAEAGPAVLSAALHLAVVASVLAPGAWWAARRRDEPALTGAAVRTLLVAAVLYLGSVAVLSLPRLPVFADLTWNWQNKIALLVLLCVVIHLWPSMTWEQVGIVRPAARWWIPVLAVVGGALGSQLVVGPMAGFPLTPETVAFQSLVPGLDEELLYRGLLLVVIDRAFVARRRMWGAELGWAAVGTTVLFGLLHGIHVDPDLAVLVESGPLVASTFAGAVLLWVRIRTRSLWTAILVHNGINASAVAATALAT